MRLDLSTPRNHLKLIAEEINREQASLPILMADICKIYGVTISWEASVPRGKGFLRYNKAGHEAPRILLSPLDRTTTRGRFCAAHELAHYFLINDYDLTPRDQREYWKIEEVCDEFARLLLLPDAVVQQVFQRRMGSAWALWKLCIDYSDLAMLPWVQVGIRISDFQSGTAFLTLEQSEAGDFMVRGSSLPKHKGRGTKLDVGTEDWELCQTLLDAAKLPGSRGPRDLSEEVPKCGKLWGLLESAGASQVVAEARLGASAHIKMVMA